MKIAVVNTPFATHIGRTIYVLECLKARGHDIELWGSGATRELAVRHEMTYRELPLQTDFAKVMQRRLQPHEIFTELFFKIAEEQLPTVLDYCERYTPHVIEANSRVFAATVASKLTGIPVVTHCCSGNSFSQIPEDLYGFCVRGTESERQRAIMLKLSREFFARTDDWFEACIGEPYGLGRVEYAIGLCAPEYAMAQTIRELSKPRIAALGNVLLTGPILAEEPASLDFKQYEPYCYMSLGTSPWNPAEIIERYRMLVRHIPKHLNIVIGLGGLTTAKRLDIDDARVTTFEHAPQIEAIKHSELVVCHGGCQTVHEALYFGKPIVGIPHHAEVSEMVNSVEIAGAGVRLSPAKLTRHTVVDAVERATSQEIRSSAGTLAALLREADGKKNALTLFSVIETEKAATV